MNLVDLEPELKNGVLLFWCANCKGDKAHRHRICVCPNRNCRDNLCWTMTGEFPNITLKPSYNGGCMHVNIVEGKVI